MKNVGVTIAIPTITSPEASFSKIVDLVFKLSPTSIKSTATIEIEPDNK